MSSILAVGHGGTFTITLRDPCPGVDIASLRVSENNNCSITEIIVHRRDRSVQGERVRWAWFGHLHGAAAQFVPGIPSDAHWRRG